MNAKQVRALERGTMVWMPDPDRDPSKRKVTVDQVAVDANGLVHLYTTRGETLCCGPKDLEVVP